MTSQWKDEYGKSYNPDKKIYAYKALDGVKDRKTGIIVFTQLSWDHFKTGEYIKASRLEKWNYILVISQLRSFFSWLTKMSIIETATILMTIIMIIGLIITYLEYLKP